MTGRIQRPSLRRWEEEPFGDRPQGSRALTPGSSSSRYAARHSFPSFCLVSAQLWFARRRRAVRPTCHVGVADVQEVRRRAACTASTAGSGDLEGGKTLCNEQHAFSQRLPQRLQHTCCCGQPCCERYTPPGPHPPVICTMASKLRLRKRDSSRSGFFRQRTSRFALARHMAGRLRRGQAPWGGRAQGRSAPGVQGAKAMRADQQRCATGPGSNPAASNAESQQAGKRGARGNVSGACSDRGRAAPRSHSLPLGPDDALQAVRGHGKGADALSFVQRVGVHRLQLA